MRSLLLLLLCGFCVISCQRGDESILDELQRPHDPWVIRSVLDEKPRMLTIALHEDLWVAYSTQNCALYKAWKGYVSYEGAVFDNAHGPQPITKGDAFVINRFDQPWELRRQGKPLPTEVRYLGHRFVDEQVTLMYALTAPGLGEVKVYETPEFTSSAGGAPGLVRSFTVENLAPNVTLYLKTNISSVALKSNIQSNGELRFVREEKVDFKKRELHDLDVELRLDPTQPVALTTIFIPYGTIRNQNVQEDESVFLPLGYRLIARSDCKTCHNTQVKTIGPSYVEIAEKYPSTPIEIDRLAKKIISGGWGIWGTQVMSAHPDLSMSDAQEMVRYILSLDGPESEAQDAVQISRSEYIPAIPDLTADQLRVGAATRVYIYNRGLELLPSSVGNPDMGGVMPQFANINDGEFTDLTENFAMHATGFLRIEKPGVYTFRLWSDDGSRFSLHEQVHIDHDGMHGTSSKEVTLGLDAGFHPFLLEFFQGGGGKFLSFNWRTPGAGEFEAVPTTAFFHHPDEQETLAGLSLPMSVAQRIPGDRFALEKVHPAYDLQQARPYDFLPKVGGMDFLPDGRLAVCTWDPSGAVYLLSNLDAERPNEIQVKRIASGLAEPLGLKVVNGAIHILQKQELTRLVDLDGDDLIDDYQTVSNAWQTSANFHEFAFGLEYQDGYFYANLATAIQPGGASTNPQIQDRGKVMKISAANGEMEFLAHGLRTPNGIGFGTDGELFVTDNQGDWLPSSKVVHVSEGAWFGSRSVDFTGTAGLREKKPVVWLPQDEIGNSPSTPGSIKDGPYTGQMMHGEVTHGGLKRVFVEKINGEYQGAVFRFVQGLEAGVNRFVYGPDGSIFVGGIGNPGNWAQANKFWYGLQRLKYNGTSVFEMLAVRSKSDGIEIEFTEPLREGDGWNPEDFVVRQWRYVPTENYGGPKVNDRALRILSANVSDDRKRVFLELAGMQPDHVIYVRLAEKFISSRGNGLWSTEAWYTMNAIPQGQPGFRSSPQAEYGPNVLTAEEKANGWKLLFDGKSFAGWRNYRSQSIGSDWVIDDGAMYLASQQRADGSWEAPDGGDILYDEIFENFELSLEWKIGNCSNSGILFSVVESEEYEHIWETGAEMQVLDNSCHPDARFVTHRAGDLYDLISCSHETVNPAGQWNKVRILKEDGHVEFWLNGVQVVEFQMYNDNWNEMIANSKFKDMPGFGQAKAGYIALQDHDDQVWYRGVKVRRLE